LTTEVTEGNQLAYVGITDLSVTTVNQYIINILFKKILIMQNIKMRLTTLATFYTFV